MTLAQLPTRQDVERYHRQAIGTVAAIALTVVGVVIGSLALFLSVLP